VQFSVVRAASKILATGVHGSLEGRDGTVWSLYKNATFKKIIMPNSNVPTYADAVSPGKNLIAGFSDYKGFIATCE
jgi:hypothetical protein